jgi:putative ubiquitin-RnfH superfamily antitoxin RatB of RatAB toxin-antitoxin module
MEPLTRRRFEVEVVYALDACQFIKRVTLSVGATAGEAVVASGLGDEIPGIGQQSPLARFGRLIGWDTPLMEGDRVDILRPLNADPKESRRRRALAQTPAKRQSR